VTKLKASQGSTFTHKIEGMLNDFALTAETGREYADAVRGLASASASSSSSSSSAAAAAAAHLPCEFTVQLLTESFWPTQLADQGGLSGLQLPSALAACLASYELYFGDRHRGGRKVNWKHALGEAEVEAHFPRGKYRLGLNTLQAAALALFSGAAGRSGSGGGGRLTVGDVRERLNVNMEIVQRILHSFACAKFKLLEKFGPGGKSKIDPVDEFEVGRASQQTATTAAAKKKKGVDRG
jgi:hypothetical protein